MYIPSEVWEIVFEQVQARNKFTSGYDLLNTSHACQQFQEILSPTKCVWLFKEIFPFLLSPLKYQKGHVLPLRQVCKAWRDAVDHVLENYEYYLSKLNCCNYHDTKFYQNRYVIPFIHPLGDLRALTLLYTVQSLERILQLEKCNQNIFPGGGVLFHTDHAVDEYKTRFCNLLTEVLIIYGHKISYLEVGDTVYPAGNFKQLLFQHLLLLPNLKSLSLILYSVSDDQILPTNANCIAFPKLPKLEALKFINRFHPTDRIPTLNVEFVKDLCLSFFPYNMHIKQFQLDGFHFALPFKQYFKPVKDNLFLTDITMKLYSDQEFDRLLILLNWTNQIENLTLYCVGGKSNWKSGTQVLDKLLSSLCARHFNIKTLRIFCTIPNTILMHSMADLAPESTIILRKLRKLKHLRCLHLYGFTFMQQCIFPFLPRSLSCLVLDCVEYTKVFRNTRHMFCFPSDLIQLHDDKDDDYPNININIRPRKAWARFLHLKHISLRTLSERTWRDEQEDTFRNLTVFQRPVNAGNELREKRKTSNGNLKCLFVLIYLAFIVLPVVIIYLKIHFG